MIVTVTYGGKPFGSPMDDLREDDLLWFIKAQLELGREIHIAPESAMIGNTCAPEETPPPQTAPGQRMEHCRTCFWYGSGLCLLPNDEYLKPKQPNDSYDLGGGLNHGAEE